MNNFMPDAAYIQSWAVSPLKIVMEVKSDEVGGFLSNHAHTTLTTSLLHVNNFIEQTTRHVFYTLQPGSVSPIGQP